MVEERGADWWLGHLQTNENFDALFRQRLKVPFYNMHSKCPVPDSDQIISPSPHQAVDSAVSFDAIALP